MRLRSSSIASTNTESTDTEFSLPLAVRRTAFICTNESGHHLTGGSYEVHNLYAGEQDIDVYTI